MDPTVLKSLKSRTHAEYRFFLYYRTRWSDNDQYAHMNNAIYYHLFNSIINTYLIKKCDDSPATSQLIGIVVSSSCQYFSPLSFPQVIHLGLRVNKLGLSSVSFEIAAFKLDESSPAAVGSYTYAFVDRQSKKSTPMGEELKRHLRSLLVGDGESSVGLTKGKL
ncbi:hypothetical protein K443DRAFT_679394 [Laccaria amethystina LaAM-08-1]|uniref:Thioesterase domain-containing protein n=1 Tax=Laccaria amethystina LaAM-08-1 TaxID=1095629 RepID=A0A0C9XEU0_9AGAR|nr:hypothetical protein K443DRAFT_679394 [Laccaria amethystina LaAM-08-1]